MARFACVCGYQIRTSGDVPNPLEWRLISDEQFETFHGTVDVEAVYRATTVAYRCPESAHLWIFWDGFEGEPSLYAPTSPSHQPRPSPLREAR